MKRTCGWVTAMVMVLGVSAGLASADIAVVIEHQWTVSNNNLSAFAYDWTANPHEFRSAGYGSNNDLRWSRVLDDSVEPWVMEGGTVLSPFQWDIFGRNGFAANVSTFGAWGMNYCPLDGSYIVECLSILRGWNTGSVRLDEERDIIKHFPGLPDSPQLLPTNCLVSDAGGVYTLTDNNLTSTNGFLASGVQVGHRVTVFPVDINATVNADTYTILEVLSNNQLRLDKDPTYTSSTVGGIGYILSVQPHVTLGTFRQNMQYYADNLTTGPKPNKKGGLSLDGTTLYIPEIVTGTLLAVDTQVPEQFTVYVDTSGMETYVQAQVNAGRRKAIINPDFIYTDSIDSAWNNASVDTTVVIASTEQYTVGTKSLKATFTTPTAKLVFASDVGSAPPPSDYGAVNFWIHGGATGGQQMDLWVINSNGIGSSVTVPAPLAATWTNVVVPMNQFTVVDDIFWIEFRNTAGAAQDAFYIDQLVLDWSDPLPAWVGAFDPTAGKVSSGADAHVDSQGRLWIVEGETGDILWTTDGVTFHTFLTSNEFHAASQYQSTSQFSNGLVVNGLTVDDMGTVYWKDNLTVGIWKAPAVDPANNIMCLASKAELAAVFGFNPRGMSNFAIRGSELLTYNFVDGNFIYKVDLDTFDYGDLDADFDADLNDYAYFQRCFNQDATTNGCDRCDLDGDVDVDLDDYDRFAPFIVGPNK